MIQEERPLPGGLFFETWIGDDSMETIREKIQKILDETVNLQLAAHNGSASLSDFADGVAWVRFHGACANCMSASETLEDVVKEAILQAVPEVKDVRLDDTVSEDLLEMARRILNHEIG